MSSARKLQAEISAVLKKIAEGNEEFDNVWEKVYSATSASQKGKFEVRGLDL
jgi:CCR4-NOT transcriptional regulation complex NOT5 subunit